MGNIIFYQELKKIRLKKYYEMVNTYYQLKSSLPGDLAIWDLLDSTEPIEVKVSLPAGPRGKEYYEKIVNSLKDYKPRPSPLRIISEGEATGYITFDFPLFKYSLQNLRLWFWKNRLPQDVIDFMQKEGKGLDSNEVYLF
jgi:hypothetical protein